MLGHMGEKCIGQDLTKLAENPYDRIRWQDRKITNRKNIHVIVIESLGSDISAFSGIPPAKSVSGQSHPLTTVAHMASVWFTMLQTWIHSTM